MMIWLKRIWNLILLVLRLIAYLAAVIVYAVGWGICQAIFHLLRWAEVFRVQERCQRGFEFLKNEIVQFYTKLKNGVLDDWKPILFDEQAKSEILDIDSVPIKPEPEPSVERANEPIVAELDDTPKEPY